MTFRPIARERNIWWIIMRNNYIPWLIAPFGPKKYRPDRPTLYICSFQWLKGTVTGAASWRLLLIRVKMCYPRFRLWFMIPSVSFLILSLDLLIPDFTNFDAMEQHLGSTLYIGARKTYHSKIWMMIYKKERLNFWHSLLCWHSLGSSSSLTPPTTGRRKNACTRGYAWYQTIPFYKSSFRS